MSGLLVEVGVEELPGRDVARAGEAFGVALSRAVADLDLGGGDARVFATPRRLAVYLSEVAERQSVGEREVRGPSRERAYDADGKPTQALLGFCRGQGIGPGDVHLAETSQGPYVMARVPSGGRSVAEILPGAIQAALDAVPFSRFMRWGDGSFRFGRPVVWLVVVHGHEVVPAAYAGVEAGRESRGHRFLAPGPVALGRAEDYEERLREAFVLADRGERRRACLAAVRAAAAGDSLIAEVIDSLLDEVTDLVEWPTAFVGRFAERYLILPDAALTTPMVHHQRYFPTRELAGGARANAFVGVRNGDARSLERVRKGNESVLGARLADALFFYERDRTLPLDEMRLRLKGVELGGGLGSMLDRADRVEHVAMGLVAASDEAPPPVLQRAAHLVFVDRASHMVGEFPELGGVMGSVYATAAGEPVDVAQAVVEATHPADAEDRLPAAGAGRLVALAVRAEELVAGWSAGRAPTGSEDPYGLRRAALALAKIGLGGGVPGGVPALLAAAARALAPWFDAASTAAAATAVERFLAERVEGLVVDQGVASAVAQAVCAAGLDPMQTLVARARALEAFLAGESADLLITAYRRAARLLEQAGASAVAGAGPSEGAPWLGAAEADRRLAAAVAATRRAIAAGGGDEGDHAAYFAAVASLAEPLDAFFREVMVMDPDPEVRGQRLAILRDVVGLASRHADLSRIGRRREETVGA